MLISCRLPHTLCHIIQLFIRINMLILFPKAIKSVYKQGLKFVLTYCEVLRPNNILANMNALIIAFFAGLAVAAYAAPSGHGVIVKGPSGIVTDHGAVHSHWGGHDDGHWDGHDDGHWDDGHWDGHNDGHWDDGSWSGHWDGHDGHDGHWDGHDGHHSNVVHGNGATLIGPGHGHAVISGPHDGHDGGVWAGHGGWGGHGVWGGYGHGHGVVVKGPHTVPATIVGPAGKIHAEGLWGPTHHHGGHHW